MLEQGLNYSMHKNKKKKTAEKSDTNFIKRNKQRKKIRSNTQPSPKFNRKYL